MPAPIDRLRPLLDAGPHEALHEGALEQQEAEQRGADLIRLEAATSDQLTPRSGEAKTGSPTVMGNAASVDTTSWPAGIMLISRNVLRT